MSADSTRGPAGPDGKPPAARAGRPRVIEPFSSVGQVGPLSEAERMQSEYETDRLIELAVRAQMVRADSAFYTNERFIGWLARDLRERMELRGSVDRLVVERITQHVYARVQAVRLGVAEGGPLPTLEPPRAATSVDVLINDAARTRRAPQWELSVAAGTGRELWDEPCDALIPLPAEVPSARYVALRVSGDSMTPLFHAGDVVLVKLGKDIARDRVIVVRTPDEGYVVKQVSALTRRRVELRSLNPSYDSIAIPRDPSRVLGTVVLRWCDHDVRRTGATRPVG